MAEVEPQVQAGNVPESISNLTDASGSGSGTHGIHEAAGFEAPEENVLSGNPTAYDVGGKKGIKGGAPKSPTSAKTNMPGKSLAKTNGSPTVVKKVINSGTFGSGSIKPHPLSKAHSPLSKASPSATLALKKSISAPSPSKPLVSPGKASTAPPASTTTVAHARRTSLVPPATKPAAPQLSKAVSAYASSKPTAAASPPTRNFAASPTASDTASRASNTTKLRAPVSEGVRKAPISARQSLAGKLPSSPKTSVTRPSRATAPAESSKAPKEDKDKLLEEIKIKLKEATESLEAKSDALVELEDKLRGATESATAQSDAVVELTAKLKDASDSLDAKSNAAEEVQAKLDQLLASTETTLVELASARSGIENLEGAKQSLRAEADALHQTIQKHEADGHDRDNQLQRLIQELEAAKTTTAERDSLIKEHQDQIGVLEGQVISTTQQLKELEAKSQLAATTAAEAASVEHAALLKAQADFVTIKAELETSNASLSQALGDIKAKLAELESKEAEIKALSGKVAELNEEKEQAVSKISELEVEVLEAQDSQGLAEDRHNQSLARLKSLEELLAQAAKATEAAELEAKAKEEQHHTDAVEARKAYEAALEATAEHHAKAISDIEALKVELTQALAVNEQAKLDAQAAAEGHARKLSDAETLYVSKQSELFKEIQRANDELESQGVRYNQKVNEVKAQHAQSLQEAFERAKTEAGMAHSQELQALRVESNAMVEQLRVAHQTSIDDLKAEHANILESRVKELEKKLSNQAIELKATQDDLAKAKASHDGALAEIENLKTQLEDARRAHADILANPPPGQIEEIERLRRELANSGDERAALRESLALTKSSMEEALSNHNKDLEEAAKGRAEQVAQLTAHHDGEMKALAGQKSELLVKLSDLEGELNTLKASAKAEASNPKTNGAAQIPSPGISELELQQMHQAHNLKMHDLQAEHEKAMKGAKEELQHALAHVDGLKQDVERREMEIALLEQDQDEKDDAIAKLKEELQALKTSDVD